MGALKRKTNGSWYRRYLSITIVVLLVVVVAGCDGLLDFANNDNNNGTDSEQQRREGALQAQEILDGLLRDIVGPVLALHGASVSPLTTPRTGSEKSWDASYGSFSPPGEGFSVTGTIQVDVVTSNPLKLRAHTPMAIQISGHAEYASVKLNNITAEWAAGANPEGTEPQSITGDFVFSSESEGSTTKDASEIMTAFGSNGDKPEYVELGGGLMGVVGHVLRFYHIMPDYGMLVNIPGTGSNWQANLEFRDFSPPGTSDIANGKLEVQVSNQNPFTVRATTPQEIVHSDSSGTTRIQLNATVVWADGANPMGNEPEEITGTITINGTEHKIEEIGLLPAQFRTADGSFEQSFKDRAWRPATGSSSEPWSRFNYMRFDVAADGRSHVHRNHTGAPEQPDGEVDFSGPLMWNVPASGLPSIWFGNSAGGHSFEFYVVDHSATHLILKPIHGWGDAGEREFLFTAGTDNLSGLLVEPDSVREEGLYDKYHPPISNATVKLYLGFPNGSPVAETSTDARGYFAFTELSLLPGDVYSGGEIYITVGGKQTIPRGQTDVESTGGYSFRLIGGPDRNYFVWLERLAEEPSPRP